MFHKRGNDFRLPLALLDVDALVADHFGAHDSEKSGARGKKRAAASAGAKTATSAANGATSGATGSASGRDVAGPSQKTAALSGTTRDREFPVTSSNIFKTIDAPIDVAGTGIGVPGVSLSSMGIGSGTFATGTGTLYGSTSAGCSSASTNPTLSGSGWYSGQSASASYSLKQQLLSPFDLFCKSYALGGGSVLYPSLPLALPYTAGSAAASTGAMAAPQTLSAFADHSLWRSQTLSGGSNISNNNNNSSALSAVIQPDSQFCSFYSANAAQNASFASAVTPSGLTFNPLHSALLG